VNGKITAVNIEIGPVNNWIVPPYSVPSRVGFAETLAGSSP
jgi:hypothetical protein